MKTIWCFSLLAALTGCATQKSEDLLSFAAEESFPQLRREEGRLPVYLFPHLNSRADVVAGTWIAVKDPR